MMKKTMIMTALALASMTSAYAQDTGVYVSGSLFHATLSGAEKSKFGSLVTDVNKPEGGYGVVIGYQFHPNFAAEVSSNYLGKFRLDKTAGNGNEYAFTDSLGVALVGQVAPFESASNFKVNARVGVASTTTTIKYANPGTEGTYAKSNVSVATYGVGMSYSVTKSLEVGVNVDVYQNVSDMKVDFTIPSLSVKYRF